MLEKILEFLVYPALDYTCQSLESDECFQIYPVYSVSRQRTFIIIILFHREHQERPIEQESRE